MNIDATPPLDLTQPMPAPAPARWPALARAAWFPVITDGYASFCPGTSNESEEGTCTFTVQ